MNLYDIGRVCVKIAGRDSRLKCVVIDVLSNNLVMIDGQTRRRKCNIAHLEPLQQTLDIKKNASHAEVISAFKTMDIEIEAKSPKKESAQRPRKIRKTSDELRAQKDVTGKTKEKLAKESRKAVEELVKAKAAEKAADKEKSADKDKMADKPKKAVKKSVEKSAASQEAEVKDALSGE